MNFRTEAQLRQELEEVWAMLRTAQAAERTLQNLGYTYHGGELWKPPPTQPAASGEPVAFGFPNSAITGSARWMMLRESVPADDQYGGALWVPLYAAPHPAPARVPLTDEQIDSITRELWGQQVGALVAVHRLYARAVLHAAGITAKEAP